MQHVSCGVTPKCQLLSPGVTRLHHSAGWIPWSLNLGVTGRGGSSTRLSSAWDRGPSSVPVRGDAVVQRDEDRTDGKI